MIFRCPFCHVPVGRGMKDCPSCQKQMVRPCPACSEDISLIATVCKYCGESAVESPRPVSVNPRRARPEIEFIEEPKATIAWEEPKRGFFSRWWGTAREANFSAESFFTKMPRSGGYAKPIGFVYGMFVQVALIAVIVLSLAGGAAALHGVPMRQQDMLIGLSMLIGALGLGYVAVAAGLFIATGFWHVVAKLFGGQANFEGTFRVVSYSYSAQVWGLIPYIGGFINAIMSMVLLYHGFRQVHGLSKGRALAAIFLPAILVLGFVLVALCVVAAACCGASCC